MAGEGGTIDSLSIEIGASTEEATRKISSLVSVLKDMKDVSRVTISSTLSTRIKELAGALNAISVDKIANLGRLANAIRAFSDVGSASLPKNFANNLFDLAAAASEISPDQVRNLSDLGNAIRTGLGSLEDSFSEKIRDVGNALTYFTNIKTGSINKSLPSQLAEIGTVIRQFNEEDLSALNEVSGSLQRLGASNIRISEEAPERLQRLFDVITSVSSDNITKIDRITSSLQKLQGVNLKGLGDAAKGLSGITFNQGIASLSASANGLNKTVQNATKLYKIVNSLGRVAFYRLIRSAIKAVTDALNEGTTNAYNFSKVLGDSTSGVKTIAEAYDSLSSASFKLTNQMGAAWSSLIRAIEPILIQIINLVTMAANAITQLFAAFGGSGTYLKAIDYNKEWGKSAAGAGKAAKEWRNQLLGFDEINRLEEPNQGGGGGGGAATPDYKNMFAITPISSGIQDFVAMVKNHITELELFAEGALLGIGLALLFSGANIPLGLALTAAGAALLAHTVTENWGAIKEKIGATMSGIMLISGLAFGIGAALAFSGTNIPLGLALMAAGALTLASAAALNWDDMPEKIRRVIGDIDLIVAGALLGIGLILTLATPGFSAIGLAMIAAGVATGAAGAAINWDYMKSNIGDALTAIMAIAAGALLAMGLILTLTGAQPLLGLALLAAGAGTLVAASKIDSDAIKKSLQGTLGFIMTIAGGAMLAIGLILACTGVALPLGLALMVAGGAALGVGATHYDWDALPNKIEELCEKIKRIFKNMWEAIKGFFIEHFGNFANDLELFIGGIKQIFEGIIDFVAGVFTGDWDRAWRGVGEIFGGVIDTIWGYVSSAFDFLSGLIGMIADAISWLRGLFTGLNELANSNAARIEADGSIYLQGFAGGGFPENGHLFIARESGPEMVGTIGGNTAVANNDQIVEAIRLGVYDGVAAAMGSGNQDVSVRVYLDSREIKVGQNRLNRAMGVA